LATTRCARCAVARSSASIAPPILQREVAHAHDLAGQAVQLGVVALDDVVVVDGHGFSRTGR
jgi:hypothetical protein